MTLTCCHVHVFLVVLVSSFLKYTVGFSVPPHPISRRSKLSSATLSSRFGLPLPPFQTAVSAKAAAKEVLFWPAYPLDITTTNINADKDSDDDDNGLSNVLDSILKIHCTHSEPDYLIPWQRTHQSTSTSSGFCISVPGVGNRVMTNAHSVEYGSIVQVQRRGDEHKYQAVVETIANECDLAVLQVDDPDFWIGLKPLEFGPLPALQDEVEVLGYPTGGDSLSITQGVVSRIEMQEYSQASSHLLAIQIDAAINPGNSGGPVLNENLQVIGVAFQGLDGAENIGYVVPVTVALHVLHDIKRNGQYTGFCSLGVSLSRLENKSFRKSLGMTEKGLSGIMIKELSPMAPSGEMLLPNDVICKADGIPVANDGKIPFRPGERVSLSCYIQTKFVGDKINLQVLRGGNEIDLDVPVSISRQLVPAHWDNQPPPYLVVAGLVFTVLSEPYLHASNAWEDWVSDSISYFLGKWRVALEREGDQVVVLAQVLAHQENLGYDRLSDLHLEKVNDQKVRSLHHLKSILDDCKEQYLRFEFSPDIQIVVLEHASVDAATYVVCQEHSIRQPFFLHTATQRGEVDSATDEKDVAESLTKATINGHDD